MHEPTTYKLIRGVHAETPIPRLVRQQRWPHRAAIVLDSYVPGRREKYFDCALFLRLLRVLDRAIGGTSRYIRISNPTTGEARELSSMAELQEFYHGHAEEDRELPETILWFDDAVPIGGGFPEKWYSINGPELYHDSYTFSVFSAKEVFPFLQASATIVSATTNSRLLGVFEGGPLAH